MFKKFSLLFLCVCICICTSTVLCGCGEDKNEKIVGDWIPTTATIGGKTIQYTELDNEKSKFNLSFSSDGRCTAVLAGIENEGTYEFNTTSVDMVLDGYDERKLKYEGGKLILTFDYGKDTTSITFSKSQEN